MPAQHPAARPRAHHVIHRVGVYHPGNHVEVQAHPPMKSSKPPARDEPTVVVGVDDVASSAPPPIPPAEESLELDVPSLFDEGKPRFHSAELLGEGGTSRVYAAFDGDLEREVAIKVVPIARASTEQQFAREIGRASGMERRNS